MGGYRISPADPVLALLGSPFWAAAALPGGAAYESSFDSAGILSDVYRPHDWCSPTPSRKGGDSFIICALYRSSHESTGTQLGWTKIPTHGILELHRAALLSLLHGV